MNEIKLYPIQCKCNHKGLICIGYDDTADYDNHYKLQCPACNTVTHVHENAMDYIIEAPQLPESTLIKDTGLSIRAQITLVLNGIKTIGQLRLLHDSELRKLRNIGENTYHHIKDYLMTC